MLRGVAVCGTSKGRYYIARTDQMDKPLIVDVQLSAATLTCTVCADAFECPEMAGCPFHYGAICSLCCSLGKNCHDACKKTGPVDPGLPAAVAAQA
jgi:hypothetical protein